MAKKFTSVEDTKGRNESSSTKKSSGGFDLSGAVKTLSRSRKFKKKLTTVQDRLAEPVLVIPDPGVASSATNYYEEQDELSADELPDIDEFEEMVERENEENTTEVIVFRELVIKAPSGKRVRQYWKRRKDREKVDDGNDQGT